MCRDSQRDFLGEVGVPRGKVQEPQHRSVEVLHIGGLCLLASLRCGCLFLRVALGRAFRQEVLTDPFNGVSGSPDAEREHLAALFLRDHEVIARSFDPSGQGWVTGREQHPLCRDGDHLSLGRADCVGLGTGRVGR